MSANFLQKSRHRTVYYFRRRVPADIFAVIGKRQIYKSLLTSDRREAIVRARALAAQTDNLFASLRAMPNHEYFSTDYTVFVDFNVFGCPKSVRIEAEPGEQDAAQKALETTLAALQARHDEATKLAPRPTPERASLTIDEGIAEYLSKADVKPTTRASYKTKLAYLVKIAGARTPLFDIDQARFVKVAEAICADASRSDQTKGDYITVIGGVLNWYRIRKGLPLLAAATLKPKRLAPPSQDRDAFSLDQLAVIFRHVRQFRNSEPHKYWVAVAIALLGCRVEELAQVNLATDLRRDQKTGVWYFAFEESTDEDGVLRKSLKKHSSWRHVPIHSALVAHGFIEYLNAQSDSGWSRLFEAAWKPHVGNADTGGIKWSHKITKWGGGTLKTLQCAGLLPCNELAFFHSMRHTFASTLAAARVSEEFRSAIQGQAFGGINAQT